VVIEKARKKFLNWYNIFRYGHSILFIGIQITLIAGIVLEWLRDRRIQRLPQRSFAGPDGKVPPLVSVIVPVHNEAGRIGGLLKSLAV
jgi:cellulose synthase/poly-beta-1,6-N-acetylglucosamine synthase-like glycosyltransferase